MEVKPLSQDDAMQLLRQDVVNAVTEDFADILKHCRGLPPLVLRLGQLLSGDSVLTNTRDDLKQVLSQEAERLFEGLSQEVQGHVTTLTQLLGGSFSEEALVAALGVKQSRGQTVLRRLCEESSAVFDPTLRRVHIKPLVMFHVRRFGHVDADDQARLRVVTFVGRVLVRAERELYLQDLDTVYGYVQGEWPQLQHVLRQAIHCTGDTFHAFLKVAMQAESLLVRCFPEEATDFFRKLAAAAVTFGKPRDQAMLQGMIGMAGTQCAEMTGWQEALDCFDRALPEVRKDPRSPFLPRLLCFIGSTYFRLSQMQKAQEFLTEAWKACEMTEAEEEKVVFLLILIRSLLALPIIFTGHLSEGKELVLKTLELVDKQPYRHHPHRPVLINTLGIVYERSGEDQEKALHYYEQSLAARRPFAKVAPRDLIAPLHNIAMQHCRRGNYDKAVTLLYESADIMRDTPHSSTAMTHENLGYVYLLKARSEVEVNSTRACNYFRQAEQQFLEAARIHAMLSPLQDGRMKLALFMAHVYVTPPCRDVMQVKNYLRQACDVLENDGDDLTNQGLLMAMSAVQHRLQLDGWQAGSKHLLKLARQTLPGLPVMPFGALGIPGQQIPGLNLVPGHGTSASSWTREGNIYYQYCHTDSRPVVNITNNVTTSVNIRKMEAKASWSVPKKQLEDFKTQRRCQGIQVRNLRRTLEQEEEEELDRSGHVTTLAQLLDGTFSVDVLQAALGLEGARAKTVLRRLHDESSVVIDTASRRVRVQPLLVHHARLRVVTLLGRVLVNAERELYLKDQDTVYGYVQGEWPQLQHVLRQAIHCTGDTFLAFRKVAFEAEKLLVRCFPEEATEFFRKMAAAAVRFGTPRDQAALQGLIGMAITQSRAMTGWKEAMDCFDRALPVMRQDRKSLVLPRLLCSIGSAYFRLSRHQEAEKYLKEALKACSVTQAEVEQVNFLLIQVRSLLALPLIFRGQFTKVKPLLLETLDLCDAQPYKEHPHKPVLINSLGLVYERSGESQEKALGYYLKSLSERRRYMKVQSDIVKDLLDSDEDELGEGIERVTFDEPVLAMMMGAMLAHSAQREML
nr:hypothetical protein BaRGS_032491 [Batillaria attramentaria]